MQNLFLGRQPILDSQQRLFGYELLFRASEDNRADITDDLAATSALISHVFAEFGVEQVLGPYLGFINADARMFHSDLIELLPHDKMVLEVLETVDITPTLVERLTELKAKGFTLALDDYIEIDTRFQPILHMIDIVKVDIQNMPAEKLGEIARNFKRYPIKLLAEKVDSPEQVKLCQTAGYVYFQGYYFAKPTIIKGRKLGQSQLSILRLMNLLINDADTLEIEKIFKTEPGLSLNLLRLVNSVSMGLSTPITSLRQAITTVGHRPLQRWLQLLLYTNPQSGDVGGPLLQLAATRGRLMELVTTYLHSQQRDLQDRAFMTGIMSLMPALLGSPMEEVVTPLKMDQSMQDALLQRKGFLGQLLNLMEAVEQDENNEVRENLTCELGLNATTLNSCLAEAVSWVNQIAQQSAAAQG